MQQKKVAVIGLGDISDIYLKNIKNVFQNLELYGVCTHRYEKAVAVAEEYHVPNVYRTIDEICADPEAEIVVNLTRPDDHFEVTMKALKAGKHVYTEKPLGVNLEEGKKICEFAAEKGLLVAGAPDTTFGSMMQTARRCLDDGLIGTPIGVQVFMTNAGNERWHPNPEFFYKKGAGPMLDVGPYYLTSLVYLLGSVEEVMGMSRMTFPQRVITSQPHYGKRIDVEVPTFQTGILKFASGILGTIFLSFDVQGPDTHGFKIFGTEGTLLVDRQPFMFGGSVKLSRSGDKEYTEMPVLYGYSDDTRGIGVADLARAIDEKRPPRSSAELMYHVLEISEALEKSGEIKSCVPVLSRTERPEPVRFSKVKGEF